MALRGDRLRAAREARGYTLDTLAKLVEVSAQQIARWESDTSDPAASFVLKLAQALAISSDYLLGLVDQPFVAALNARERKLLDAYRAGTLIDLVRRYLQSSQRPSAPMRLAVHSTIQGPYLPGKFYPYDKRNFVHVARTLKVGLHRYECPECRSVLNAPSAVGHPHCPHCGTEMLSKKRNP